MIYHFMQYKRIYLLPFLLLSSLVFSCKTIYQPQSVAYVDYRINKTAVADSGVLQLLQPYADSVNKSMNTIIAVAATELEKKQPEGTLGNFMADAMLIKARELYKMPVDAAFVNYGGIRLTNIMAGNITRGKIFELAPFDNIIVLQKISGKTLQLFLNHISGRGGWPVAGIGWQIKNKPDLTKEKMAINILINGLPIDETAQYTIAFTDYIANGGDDCNMLRPIPQINKGYLFRDALINYCTDMHQQGKEITAIIQNRVSNAE
jgi:2',3'-cyclic-nucleotide 2'-phosphodiesterase (5'-nucleotidase family)